VDFVFERTMAVFVCGYSIRRADARIESFRLRFLSVLMVEKDGVLVGVRDGVGPCGCAARRNS
jgi:hypothetical protein